MTALYRTTEIERGCRDSWEVHEYNSLFSSVTEEGWNKLLQEVTKKNQSIIDWFNGFWKPKTPKKLVARTEGVFPNITVTFNEEEGDDMLRFTTSISIEEITVDKTL